jgi:hypothetical protein
MQELQLSCSPLNKSLCTTYYELFTCQLYRHWMHRSDETYILRAHLQARSRMLSFRSLMQLLMVNNARKSVTKVEEGRWRNKQDIYASNKMSECDTGNRLCGLVVRVPGYRSRGPGFDSRHYKIFWLVLGLERRPFSFMSANEELFGKNISGSSLENREYDRGDTLRWPRDTLYLQKLALTSKTSGRSV